MQYTKKAFIASVLVVTLAAMLITATAANSDVYAAKKVKPVKPTKCNNVKIQLGIQGLDGTANQTLIGSMALNGISRSKVIVTEENETFAVMNFMYKKISPCPSVGQQFSGFVNGTEFSGTINSLKKPNRASVDLS